jgi:hypothetical protein
MGNLSRWCQFADAADYFAVAEVVVVRDLSARLHDDGDSGISSASLDATSRQFSVLVFVGYDRRPHWPTIG